MPAATGRPGVPSLPTLGPRAQLLGPLVPPPAYIVRGLTPQWSRRNHLSFFLYHLIYNACGLFDFSVVFSIEILRFVCSLSLFLSSGEKRGKWSENGGNVNPAWVSDPSTEQVQHC